MIGLYGLEVDGLRTKRPDLYRALWVFRFRAADRHAWRVSRGIAAALGKQDSSYYQHVTETEAQAMYAEDMAKGAN